MERNYLSNLFRRFEEDYHESLNTLFIGNFNAWSVVKFPLFYGLIQQGAASTGNNETVEAPAVSTQKLFQKAGSVIKCLASLSSLLVKARFKKGITLLYTYSGDKPAKDSSGRYFNFLTDPFIKEQIITSYLYAERSLSGDYKEPGFVQKDFRVDDLQIITALYGRRYVKNEEVRKCADRLFGLLNEHFGKQGTPMTFSSDRIVQILAYFYAEYKTGQLFLRACKPSLIIAAEMPGKGMLAAARELNISLLDLQHGIIDHLHPQYIYDRSLKPAKASMVLPDFIGVFGQLHKNIVCGNGFWDDQEIVVLGSSRVDMNREKYAASHGAVSVSVLVPTQWTMFTELQSLLPALCAYNDSDYKVILKIHPHEPEKNVQYFTSLAQQYPNRMIIAERNTDIYELIAASMLVVGFDSAVLLESLTLSKPCITITTPASPYGIHGMFNNDDRLKTSIRPVAIEDAPAIPTIIDRMIKDKSFYDQWVADANRESDFLYAKDYVKRCDSFIKTYFSDN
jgi:hypothetical protein